MEKPQREEREGKIKRAGSYPESNRISYTVGDRSPRFKLSVSTVSCLPLKKFHTLKSLNLEGYCRNMKSHLTEVCEHLMRLKI